MTEEAAFYLDADEAPKPWSPQARANPDVAADALARLAGSPARERLVATIRRYCRGLISGHAVLVSGHRGAGKTTAVLAAMQEVHERCRAEPLGQDYRPLMVRIHGPGLLTRPSIATEGSTLEERDWSSQRCLEEMAAGLLPALLEEIRLLLATRLRAGSTPEQSELVAHALDELARGTASLGMLRETYRRLELLPRGLLGRGRAFDELTAINAAREAYQLVIGEVDDQQGGETALTRESMAELKHSLGGDRMTRALTPVAASAVAAVGLASGHWVSAVLLAIVILAGGHTFTSSRKNSSRKELSRKRNFKRDSSLDSLKRHIPILIDRLRDIGFPPVFVVDELDKVEHPAVLLEELLRNLKSFVTERSLIMFVTDPSYYADIAGSSASDARYGEGHTYYGEHIYVLSRPSDLHRYLRRVLPWNDTKRNLKKRREDLFFRLLLLGRARMHIYDLRRELRRSALSGELTGVASEGSSSLRTRAARYEVFFQLCIEWIIADSRCQEESAADRFFAQVLYSELYRVRDRWRAGEPLRVRAAASEAGTPADAGLGDDLRIAEAVVNPRQRNLVEIALDQLESFLREPGRLAGTIVGELDTARIERFTTACDVAPTDDELSGALRSTDDSELKGRSKRVVAALKASDRLWGAVLKPPLQPVLPGAEPDRGSRYIPLVDARGRASGEQTPDAGIEHRLERLRRLEADDHVRELGFDSLWGIAAPGLERPETAESHPDEMLAEAKRERNAAAADATGTIEHAFHDLLVGVAAVHRVYGSPPRAADTLEWFETALRTQTAPDERRSLLARVVLRFCSDHSIGLPPSAVRLLSRAEPPRFSDEPIALDASLMFQEAEREVDRDALQRDWAVLLALRIVSRLDSEVVPPDVVASEALDLTARALGWFGTIVQLSEEPETGRSRFEFLDTRLKGDSPVRWPIVTWAELAESASPALRAVAAERLGQHEVLGEVLDEVRAQATGEQSAVPDARAELLAWLEGRRSLLDPAAPRVALLHPLTGLSRLRPSALFTTYVVNVLDPTRGPDPDETDKLRGANFILTELHSTRPEAWSEVPYAVLDLGRPSDTVGHDGTLFLGGRIARDKAGMIGDGASLAEIAAASKPEELLSLLERIEALRDGPSARPSLFGTWTDAEPS